MRVDPVGETHAGKSANGEELNLELVDTKKIANPKKGDIALDDGTNSPDQKSALTIFRRQGVGLSLT